MKKTFLLLAVLSIKGLGFAQGSLTPPGAPGMTMKSLDQVEPRIPISTAPFSITNSGSYYLTTNLVSTNEAIHIVASAVTLDLNGFEISTTPPLHTGILLLNATYTNIVIRNGSIRRCTYGIDGSAGDMVNLTLENLQVANCVDDGAEMAGTLLVRGCSFSHNGLTGLYLGDGPAVVTDCTAFGNNQNGFQLAGAVNIQNCTAANNKVSGINAADSLVSHCVVYGNTNSGIYVGAGSRITDNLVEFNNAFAASGIFVSGVGDVVEDNSIVNNYKGIDASTANGNLIIHNFFSGNAVTNLAAGFVNTAPLSTTYNSTTISNASYWVNPVF